MENREKWKLFFVKHFKTIVVLFIAFGVIIFCVVYQPKKVQPVLELVGLEHPEFLLESQTEEVAIDSLMEQECIAELEESLSSFYSELDGCTEGGLLYEGYKKMNGEKGCSKNEKIGKQIEIMLNEKNCNSIERICICTSERCHINKICDEEKYEPCTDGECPYNCEHKSKCFSYVYGNFDACGSTDIKSNFSIKGCPIG